MMKHGPVRRQRQEVIPQTTVQVELDRNDYSYHLRLTNFGFTIPANAVINGITVTLNTTGSDRQKDSAGVRITKDGSTSTGIPPSSSTNWDDGTVVVGGGLWGTTWTPGEINSGSFGTIIRIRGRDDNSEYFLRTAQISVSYTTVIAL